MISPVVPLDKILLHVMSHRYALPVDTPIVMLPLHVTFEIVTLPVETERERAPTELFSTQILPVPVLILAVSRAAAKKLMSPVLKEISALINESSFGTSTFPVLP